MLSQEGLSGKKGQMPNPKHCRLGAMPSNFKASRDLAKKKGRQYWYQAIDFAHADTKQTWKYLCSLLGKNGISAPSNFMAEDYHSFIDSKVTNIQGRTADAGPMTYHVYSGPSSSFSPPTH